MGFGRSNMLNSQIVAALLLGCSISVENPEKPEDEPKSLTLVDSAFISEVKTHLDTSSLGSYTDLAESREGGQDELLDLEHPVAQSILLWPYRAAGELAEILAVVDHLTRELLAEDGLLKDQKLEDEPGAVTLVDLDGKGGGPNRVKILRQDLAAEFEYSVSFYWSVAGEDPIRRTHFEFTPGSQGVKVRFRHVQDMEERSMHIDARYDTQVRAFQATFGPQPVSPDRPAKTSLSLKLGQSTDDVEAFNLTGAAIWQKPDAIESPVVARYYQLQTGDLEVFRMRLATDKEAPSIQQLAFVPNGRSDEAKAGSVDNLFATYSYASAMNAHVVDLLRSPSINSVCQQTGDVFREAFTAQEPPASVKELAADVCAGNSDVTDIEVLSAITDTCLLGVQVEFELTVHADGSTSKTYNLCNLSEEADWLDNPQFFLSENGKPQLVKSPGGEDYETLENDIQHADIIDFSSVDLSPWEPAPRGLE